MAGEAENGHRGAEEEFDLYDTLNLLPGASSDEVRAAFRDLSRMYHPDKLRVASASSDAAGVAGDPGGGGGETSASAAEGAFLRVHQAYRVLGDDTLRLFYDRYGLAGVRLAELAEDDDTSGNGQGVALPEDRFKDLERRVLGLMRKRDELRTQRLLGLQGSFTLAACVAPDHHGSRLRGRYRLQYCATSHSVQIAVCENLKLTVGCASHVQGANGIGAAKLMLAAATQLDAQTAARGVLSVAGNAPEMEFSLTRSLNEFCTVQQKVSTSAGGRSLSFGVFPWLSRTMRGSLSFALGRDPSFSLGLLKRTSGSGHSARAYLNIHPGAIDLGGQLKYKPSQDFSVKVAPSLSTRGWGCIWTCTKALDSGLAKLHWVLRVRARSLQIRLTLCRSGLTFTVPVELWTEASGPLTLGDMVLMSAVWAAPPLAIRLLYSFGSSLYQGVLGFQATRSSDAADVGAESGVERPPKTADADIALEQRRLAEREAARCRSVEEASRGLVIVHAAYGDPARVATVASHNGAGGDGVLDVTDCLMAKVRCSRLHISGAPKSTLLGFWNPCRGPVVPVLRIRYRFGGIEHDRTFRDTDPVVLP